MRAVTTALHSIAEIPRMGAGLYIEPCRMGTGKQTETWEGSQSRIIIIIEYTENHREGTQQ